MDELVLGADTRRPAAFAVRFFGRFLGASAFFLGEEWEKITQSVEFQYFKKIKKITERACIFRVAVYFNGVDKRKGLKASR